MGNKKDRMKKKTRNQYYQSQKMCIFKNEKAWKIEKIENVAMFDGTCFCLVHLKSQRNNVLFTIGKL